MNAFRRRSPSEHFALRVVKEGYYDPHAGRFLNADGYVNANGDLIGFNMYAYCSNNPIAYVDYTGNFSSICFGPNSKDEYLVPGTVSVGYSGTLGGSIAFSDIPGDEINKGIDTVAQMIIDKNNASGLFNHVVNFVYYEFSDGITNITTNSYNEKYLSRWERLDYTKSQTKEAHYNLNAWRYYNEYNLHMYGWYATGWANGKDIPVISKIAYRCEDAEVFPNDWDSRPYVDIPTVILGLLSYS